MGFCHHRNIGQIVFLQEWCFKDKRVYKHSHPLQPTCQDTEFSLEIIEFKHCAPCVFRNQMYFVMPQELHFAYTTSKFSYYTSGEDMSYQSMSQDDFPQRGRCTLCLTVQKASRKCSIMVWKVFLCSYSGLSWEVRWQVRGRLEDILGHTRY